MYTKTTVTKMNGKGDILERTEIVTVSSEKEFKQNRQLHTIEDIGTLPSSSLDKIIDCFNEYIENVVNFNY